LAVNRYRGGKLRRPRFVNKDIPVSDAPLERDEVVRLAGTAEPIIEQYIEKARQGLNPARRTATMRRRDTERLRVWQLWCSGWRPAKIATELNINPVTVDQHIRNFRDSMEQGLAAIPVITGGELILHYQNLYHEAMDAWRDSRRDLQRNSLRRVERTTTSADGDETTNEQNSQITREAQYGDPRLLERAMMALDRIAVLQGLARPGSLNSAAPRQVDADQVQQAGANVPRVTLYLPDNGRDAIDVTPVPRPAEVAEALQPVDAPN